MKTIIVNIESEAESEHPKTLTGNSNGLGNHWKLDIQRRNKTPTFGPLQQDWLVYCLLVRAWYESILAWFYQILQLES